jgi:ABC-type nickel/cobalt efflux system permease component RcnA
MECMTENRNLKLVTGIMLSFAGGALVAVAVFVLTLLYLFTTRSLHTSGRLDLSIYLFAPAIGGLVTLTGATLAVRRWMRSRR